MVNRGHVLVRERVKTEMVTIEQRLHRLFRYRTFWFPSYAQAGEISESLQLNDVVRFFAVSPAPQNPPYLVEHYKVDTLWINLSADPEAVLNGMQRKSCRYEIRRAEKMLGRVAIEFGSEKANGDFLKVYNGFTRAKGLPELRARSLQDYSALCETLVLYLDGQALCGHVLLRDPEASIVRLLYSGSRRLESPEQSAACGALNRYLHWHEIQLYSAQGFRTFDFGGIGRPESISRFKLSFGGTVRPQHFYVLSGLRWLAKLGKLVSEQILRRRTFNPADQDTDENLEGAAHFT